MTEIMNEKLLATWLVEVTAQFKGRNTMKVEWRHNSRLSSIKSMTMKGIDWTNLAIAYYNDYLPLGLEQCLTWFNLLGICPVPCVSRLSGKLGVANPTYHIQWEDVLKSLTGDLRYYNFLSHCTAQIWLFQYEFKVPVLHWVIKIKRL